MTSYEYRRAFFELSITGSDDVVRAVNNYMQFFYRSEDNKDSISGQDLLINWGGLILAIRRDLANKRTKLNERDMLKALIKDIDRIS